MQKQTAHRRMMEKMLAGEKKKRWRAAVRRPLTDKNIVAYAKFNLGRWE